MPVVDRYEIKCFRWNLEKVWSYNRYFTAINTFGIAHADWPIGPEKADETVDFSKT